MAGFIFGPGVNVELRDFAFRNFDVAIGATNSSILLTNVHAYKTKTMIKGRDISIKAKGLIHNEHLDITDLKPLAISKLTIAIRMSNHGTH